MAFQLEKEVRDLILQRDIAQSQLKDLLRLLGDDGNSLIQVGLGCYPNLRVHESPDNQTQIADTTSLVDSPAFSRHSRSSFDDNNYIRIPDFEDNPQQNTPSPRLFGTSSNLTEMESYQDWEDIEKRSNTTTSEDLCKEVCCIEKEESPSYTKSVVSITNSLPSISYTDGKVPESLQFPLEKERRPASPPLREEKESGFLPLEEHEEQVSPPIKEEKQLESTPAKEEKELHCIHAFNFSAKSSPSQDLTEDASEPRNYKLSKSRSCKASLMTCQSSSWSNKKENNDNTPPNGSEREFAARPKGFDRKPFPLKFDPAVERLSSKDSHPSAGDIADMELQANATESLRNENVSSTATSTTETKEIMELHCENEVPETPIVQDEQKAFPSSKSVRDVGLDPIEDELKTLSNWPSEFKRLQREIIELWHSCHVSLVHRTYFYLLFEGDSADAIYLEVELRRLTFLKDTFSRREKTMVNGRTVSLASSKKGLRQERRMLSKQMLKKLTEQERESLFLKWNIGLDSKLRRLQLAHRLWTDTEDMNHIVDSAFIVAKLVGLIEPGKQTPKEMFGLSFLPRSASRTYSFKRSLMSLF